MRFWDSSALVPLLVLETSSSALAALHDDGGGVLAWWSTEVECASAVSRLERDGYLMPAAADIAYSRLDRLAVGWNIVEPIDPVTRHARRFLRVHPLRAADALQLAAAFVAAESDPTSLVLVTLDERLALAARREGFTVLDRESLSE